LEKTGQELLRLQALQEQFQKERQRVSKKMAALEISFDAGQPRSERRKIELELERAGGEKDQTERRR
jgi:hypothetical protein